MKMVWRAVLYQWIFAVSWLALCNSAMAGNTDKESWFNQTRQTVAGVFSVTLDSSSPAPSLNEFQEWLITVTDNKSGEQVTPARISVSGGMPMHGHGLPTQPQVTEYLGEGQYKVEGIKFNMHGQWVLEFEIVSGVVSDTIAFEVVVDY